MIVRTQGATDAHNTHRKYYSSSLRRYYPDQVYEKSSSQLPASFNGYNLSLFFSSALGRTRHPLSCKEAKIVAKKKKSVFFYGFNPCLHPTTIQCQALVVPAQVLSFQPAISL
ncbi:hypothetical protein [Paraflavitalea soli]